MPAIPHSRCLLGAAEAQAVAAVVETNYVGYGPRAAELEARFCQWTGRDYAFAVSSGSHALALALRALDLPAGSPIAVPVLCCASVFAAVCGAGHQPVLVDVSPDSLALDPACISSNCVAAVAPHAYGAPLDVAGMAALGIPWIEDCATSPATRVAGRAAGASGTLAIFSLGSTKYFTGGAGGAVVTGDQEIAARVSDLLDFDRSTRTGKWRESTASALPGRLPDLNAAVALAQFDRLPEFLERRRAIARIYCASLGGVPALTVPRAAEGHSYYRFIVRTAAPAVPVAEVLHSRGIDVRTVVNPWLDEYATALGVPVSGGAWPVAAGWRHHLLSLPIHPGMSDADAQFVGQTMEEVIRYASAA